MSVGLLGVWSVHLIVLLLGLSVCANQAMMCDVCTVQLARHRMAVHGSNVFHEEGLWSTSTGYPPFPQAVNCCSLTFQSSHPASRIICRIPCGI